MKKKNEIKHGKPRNPFLIKVMKVNLFLFFLSFLCSVSAVNLHSQNTRISLKINNKNLKELFSEIEERSEYAILYERGLADNKKVSVEIENGTPEEILDKILPSLGLSYRVEDNQIIITEKPVIETDDTQVVTQATVQARGIINDENGESMIGVSIVEKGSTSNGTITGLDGSFSINVQPGAVLEIRYLGYTIQEITVPASGNIGTITMVPDSQVLDDVVVIGYGSVKKANLTGAVDQVKGDVLENRPITNVTQALQGKIANLSISSSTDANAGGGGAPGAKMNINIRGVSGLNAKGEAVSASPLIVIDGIQGGDINTINPDDIESISVLKDAASAAIYGSNAPYGVVLVTTKKGRLGAKPTITYSNNLSWSSPINLPQMANSLEWSRMSFDAYENAEKYNYLNEKDAMQRIEDYYYGRLTTETDIDPSNAAGGYLWPANGNNDWFKIYFKDSSFSHQHNAGISGGSENSSYYVGLGYNEKNGMYRYMDDKYRRYSLRSNLSTKLRPWLTANVRLSYMRGITDSPSHYGDRMGDRGYMHNIARKWPTDAFKTPNGEYSEASEIETMLNGGGTTNTEEIKTITGEIVLDPLPGWNITANYSFTGNDILYEENRFTTYYTNPKTGEKIAMNGTSPDRIHRRSYKNQDQMINAFTSYEFEKAGHYVKGMVGFAQEQYQRHNFQANAINLYTNTVPSLNTTYGTQSVGEGRSTLTSRGAFGRINYGYKEKYLIELNGRYDGTSRFNKDVRFKFYPGVSAAWVASQESFWNPIRDYVDFFKLRASYGSLGDQSTIDSYYPFYPSLKTTGATSTYWFFGNTRESNVSFPGMINPNLTWVSSTTVDFGFDLTALNGRFATTFDWYKRTSTDAIGPSEQLPAVLGASAPNSNNAEMETKGFELTMSWRDQIQDFFYSVRATLSDSKTKITKYPNKNGLINNWYAGKYVGEIWGYETDRFFTADDFDADGNLKAGIADQSRFYSTWTPGDIKYVDRDGSGKIDPGDNTLANPGDRKIIGNSLPRYMYGITLEAAWKGFDFSIFFQGVGKRDFMSGNENTDVYFWGITGDPWQYAIFKEHLDRWTPENPNGYFPKAYLGDGGGGDMFKKNAQPQTKYLQDASYLRLKNLQIGYTLPQSVLNNLGISKLRLYVSGENLATWTDMIKTMDPEFANTQGKIYPLQRTWSFGLNMTF